MEIDYNSPVPLYQQLAELIRERIASGTYRVTIPGEPALAQETGLARGTVRRATRLLVDQGVVMRVPGKGTYIV